MDWPTTVGQGALLVVGGLLVAFLVRWGARNGDDRVAAELSKVEQLANQREAERQRDAEHVLRVKAEGENALTLADNVKLHDALRELITRNQAVIKEKIDAATDDDYVALGRAVLGVPNPRVPGASPAGSARASNDPAPAAPVQPTKST